MGWKIKNVHPAERWGVLVTAMKEYLLREIEIRYGAKPEFLWAKYPEYSILRHSKSKKWFAAFMRVPAEKLGLKGEKTYDVVNVKCPPAEVAFLQNAEGILPAYHMNKEHWLTLLLDGSLPQEMALGLIEKSYELVIGK